MAYQDPAYRAPQYEPADSIPQYQPAVPQYQPGPGYGTGEQVPADLRVVMQPAPQYQSDYQEERFDYEASKYRDLGWLILFILHLVAMTIVAIVYGKKLVDGDGDDASGNDGSDDGDDGLDSSDRNKVIGILSGMAVVGGVFGACWLAIIRRCAGNIVKTSLMIMCGLYGIGAVVSIAIGIVGMAIVYALLAAVLVCYFYCVRHRIPFAEATIQSSVRSVKDNNGTIAVTYGMALLTVVWFIYFVFILAAVMHATQRDDGSDGLNGFVYFLLLISFYWTTQVLMNIAHVTTAGAVASWWLDPLNPAATCGAFKRATTTSLGSICFGSLIVAVLTAIRTMLRQARRSARNSRNAGAAFILCCVECIIGCIENLMRYFNKYAYTQVAIYGKDYVAAAKATWDLFQSRGFEALINDDLTGMVLAIGCMMGGVVTGIIGGLAAHAANFDGWIVVAVVSFIIGYVMTALVMKVVDSAVATTYVIWAEDPQAMATQHPEEFQQIRDAAAVMHPEQAYWR